MGDALVDVILQSIDSDAIASLASSVGETPAPVSAALAAIVPAVLGGIVENKEGAGGLAILTALTAAERDEGSGGVLGLLKRMFARGQTAGLTNLGQQLLHGIFGVGGSAALSRAVSTTTGISSPVVDNLLPLATPLVVASAGMFAAKSGYSLDQLPAFLAPHRTAFLGMLPRPVSALVDSLSPPAMPAENLRDSISSTTVKKIAPWALGGLAVLGVFAGFRQCGGPRSTAVSASAPPAELVAGAPTPAGDLAVRPMSSPLSGTAASLGLAPGPAADLATILGSNDTSVPQKVVLEETRFISNRSTLNGEPSPELSDISRVLKAFPHARIAVVGHTDASSTELRNQSLSEDRAISVRDALVGSGVAADHVSTRGMGATEPIASNESMIGRAENRRVEIVVVSR